jgi:SAM-dependent methyltransferase
MKQSIEQQSIPYSVVATIYDRMMSHVNYKQWAGYTRNLFSYYPAPVESIYDISCGTGRLLPYLKSKKIRVFGSDLSIPMLRIVKNNSNGRKIPVFCSDARQLATKPCRFDVVLMLYDSMNYIIEENEVVRLLGNVAECLRDNGLFLFDVVTIKGCRDHFDKYYESDSFDNVTYVRRSWFARKENIQYNKFIISREGKTFTELHCQKIRSEKEWVELISNSPFEIINFYDNFSYRPAHKNSERIHILCKKNE